MTNGTSYTNRLQRYNFFPKHTSENEKLMQKTHINLRILDFFCTFAGEMKKIILFIALCACVMTGCNRPSRVEQHHAEKHMRDSISLAEQERSLAYYQEQLEQLLPKADSLMTYFKYERNEKYQDHGFYVLTGWNSLRILVRDDGKELLLYREGKRIEETDRSLKGKELELLERAKHLQIVISDVKECEKRIARTSLEVQKYQKRLQKQ